MLTLRNIRISDTESNRTIINRLNLDVLPNSITCLLGESGTGKTLLAKAVIGLLPENLSVTKGEIFYRKTSIPRNRINPYMGDSIFYCPQNSKISLNPLLKISAQFKDLYRKRSSESIVEILREFYFPNPILTLQKYPHQLSEGECQRIVLSMMIANQSEFNILDEPTSALDSESKSHLVKKIANGADKHVYMIFSHDTYFLNQLTLSNSPKAVSVTPLNQILDV